MFASVYITCKDATEARKIATMLVKDRLAACVNILPAESVYRWKGSVVKHGERVLVCKTRQALFPKVEQRVKELHSYSVPCIVAWPICAGNKDYLDWVARETK